jgi:hypothetical protein
MISSGFQFKIWIHVFDLGYQLSTIQSIIRLDYHNLKLQQMIATQGVKGDTSKQRQQKQRRQKNQLLRSVLLVPNGEPTKGWMYDHYTDVYGLFSHFIKYIYLYKWR